MITKPIFPELTLEFLNNVDGLSFEKLCVNLYKRKYENAHVQQTNINDFGADVLVRFDHNRTMVIQCKTSQTEKAVGVKSVQEVISSKATYGAEFAAVVTNTYFTQAAVELANKNDVELVSGDKLIWEFSVTTLDTSDLPYICKEIEEALINGGYTYLDKFVADTNQVFLLSSLEQIHFLHLVLLPTLPSRLVDVSDHLRLGLPYAMYIVLENHKRKATSKH